MELAVEYDGFTVHPPNDEPYWHQSWIPWADSDGDLHVIDTRTGRLGLAYHDGTGDFTTSYPSLAAYLDAVRHSLAHGTAVNGWYPYLTTHQELWWDLGPDKQSVNNEPLIPAFRRDG